MSTQLTAEAFRSNSAVAEQATERYQALLSRSATDMSFRSQLLTNPRAALAAFGGKTIADVPETINVKFIENSADATIVLPDFVDASAELSDRDLEAVAGGTDVVMTVIIATLAIDGGLLSYLVAHKAN